MRAMLNAAGLRVGTLTSPALISHLDRIRIDDQWIGEQTFLDHVNRYDEQWRALELAMFDIDVHIALCWFVHERRMSSSSRPAWAAGWTRPISSCLAQA